LGFASVLSLVVGCGVSAPGAVDLSGTMASPDGMRCTPGGTQSCNCLGGGEGTQTCRASGASFGPCEGCSPDEPPDGIIVVRDMGSSTCGDCDGCCDGTTCVQLANETNAQCGQRGQACAACTGTQVCGAGTGQCLDASAGCTGCTGCCGASTNNVCLVDQASQCGASCTKCSYGVTCVNGSCTTQIDQNAYFKVNVTAATVLVNSTNCPDNWDYFSEPDPYVCVGYQSGGMLYQGCNNGTYVSDSLSATWSGTDGLMLAGGSPFLVPASVITQGKMQISLYDYDYPDPDDLIAQGFFPATSTLQASYMTGMFSCATNVSFQLQ
jgi:hypothetical protein